MKYILTRLFFKELLMKNIMRHDVTLSIAVRYNKGKKEGRCNRKKERRRNKYK